MPEPLTLDPGSGRVNGATFIASPNHNARPDGVEVEALIIHAISLPPNNFGGNYVEQFFTNCLDCTAHPDFQDLEGVHVSAHFYIKRAGALLQFVSVHRRAWHAGESVFAGRANVNDFSIGIELEGCDTVPFAAPQYATLVDLTRLLFAHYPRLTRQRVVGHCDIAPERKTDPGPHFDWQFFRGQMTDDR